MTTEKTLADIRGDAHLSTREAARRLAQFLGEESRTHNSIVNIERDGTQKHSVIRGLAAIYGVSTEAIEAAISVKKSYQNG
jgi:hypothetical protein